MTRICIVCEGATEVEFVQKCLAPYLQTNSSAKMYAVNLKGNVSVERLADRMSGLYYQTNRITTLVDFYGFKHREGRTCEQLQDAIREQVAKRTTRYDARFVLPYVQMHEFEALLFSFSNPDVFACVEDGWNERSRAELQEVQRGFETPEDINDGAETAPSKRLEKIFGAGAYDKKEHGFLVAEKIGIETIRKRCPRFNEWVEQLAAWGT